MQDYKRPRTTYTKWPIFVFLLILGLFGYDRSLAQSSITGAATVTIEAPIEQSGANQSSPYNFHNVQVVFDFHVTAATNGTTSSTSTSTGSSTGTTTAHLTTATGTTGTTGSGGDAGEEQAAPSVQPVGSIQSAGDFTALRQTLNPPASFTHPLTNSVYFYVSRSMTPIKALNDTSRSFSTINVETGISATGCLLQDGDRISVWADTSGTYYFDTYLVYANPVVVSGTLVYSFTVKKDHYVIAKVSPSVQAVDTRKMYGQPNIDGGLVADANADIRNVNFYNWVFKGGIFLGNMPFGSGDNSGLSRIQVSMGTTVYTPVASSLSMMYLGVPPGQTPGLKIGLWPWAQSLANPTQYDSGANLNWATQWVPASTTLSTTNVAWPFVDGTQTSSVTLSSSTPTKEYLNWPIKFSAPTASTTYYAFPGIPTGLPYGFMVAVADEQTFFDTSETGWAYFADSAFQALPVNAIAPLNDSAARVWNVNITSSTLTNYP